MKAASPLIIYLAASFSSQQDFTAAFSSQQPAQLSPQQVAQLPSVQVSQLLHPAIASVGQLAQSALSFIAQLPQLSPQQSAQLPLAQFAQFSQPVAQQAPLASALTSLPSQQAVPQQSAQLPPAQFAQFSQPLLQQALASTEGWGAGASLREATNHVDESPRAIEANRIDLNMRYLRSIRSGGYKRNPDNEGLKRSRRTVGRASWAKPGGPLGVGRANRLPGAEPEKPE